MKSFIARSKTNERTPNSSNSGVKPHPVQSVLSVLSLIPGQTELVQLPENVRRSEKPADQRRKKNEKVVKVKKSNEKQRRKILMPRDAKLKKAKISSNILIINPKKHKPVPTSRKILTVFIDTFYEWASITKVNGSYYLRRFVTRGWLRALWSCIMIALLMFGATLIFLLYRRYVDSPTRVTISAPLSINDIPFPGITICHPQNVMEYKSKEFVKKM